MSNKLGTVLPNISCYIENANKPVFSYLSMLTTRHCPHPSAAAAAAAIDRYLVLTGPTAANLQQWVCCFWAMLKQTDRTLLCILCGQCQYTHIHLTYQKGKTNLDFTEARDSECQWHQLGHMQVCTSLQTDNHANIPPLSFLQAGCPSCRPTNSVKALKAKQCQ